MNLTKKLLKAALKQFEGKTGPCPDDNIVAGFVDDGANAYQFSTQFGQRVDKRVKDIVPYSQIKQGFFISTERFFDRHAIRKCLGRVVLIAAAVYDRYRRTLSHGFNVTVFLEPG